MGFEGKLGDVNCVVEHANGGADGGVEGGGVEGGALFKRVEDEAGQVDGAEQAGAVGRQGLFAAGIGGLDVLTVVEVVTLVDAVDEDDAGFGVGVGGAHDLVPEAARGDGFVQVAVEGEAPIGVIANGVHEGVGDEHREVEHAKPAGFVLGVDEGFDVGVVAAKRCHHRAAAVPGAHDGAAHRVPHVHEGEGAGGVGANAEDPGAARSQRREVVADAAARLHGERGLLEVLEDARHVVLDGAHDVAVEEGDVSPRARDDAPGREEAVVGERLHEGGVVLGPRLVLGFRRGEGGGDARPGRVDVGVEGLAGLVVLQTVFHVPDVFCDLGQW